MPSLLYWFYEDWITVTAVCGGCKVGNYADHFGQKLETVTSFKYLGSVITDEGSKPEILSRIAQTTAALTRLKPVGMTRVFLSAPRYD